MSPVLEYVLKLISHSYADRYLRQPFFFCLKGPFISNSANGNNATLGIHNNTVVKFNKFL